VHGVVDDVVVVAAAVVLRRRRRRRLAELLGDGADGAGVGGAHASAVAGDGSPGDRVRRKG